MQHATGSSAAITIPLTHTVGKASEAVGFSVLPKETLTCRHQGPGDGPTDQHLICTCLLNLLSQSHFRELYRALSQSTL